MQIQGTELVLTLLTGVGLIATILFSLSIHEYAHALVADLYGDSTAKQMGRQSINPLRHWDPVGTTLLVVLLLLRLFSPYIPVFGWGRPVPVNERNLANPRLDGLQVALAGPLSNLLLAALIAVIIRFTALPLWAADFLTEVVYLNIFLMLFNLLPIPPLDGSRLLRLVLPENTYFLLNSQPFFSIGFLLLVLYYLGGPVINFAQQLTTFLIQR